MPVRVSGNRRAIEQYGFVRGNGGNLLALWLPGVAEERGRTESAADVTQTTVDIFFVKGSKAMGGSIVDLLNGTEKPLDVESTEDGIVIRKMRLQDWPLIIRIN